MREVILPPLIARMLAAGAALTVSISGGKDSQAMLAALAALWRRERWRSAFSTLHCCLGRMDWPEARPHSERLAAQAGLPIAVVRREQGDLLADMQQRLEKTRGTGTPFWPSAQFRYCTSDNKTRPSDAQLRRHHLVISAEGIRAEESPARAKKQPVSLRPSITSKVFKDLTPEEAVAAARPGRRAAVNWYPIFDWTLAEVWEACATSADDIAHRRTLYAEGQTARALAGCPVAEAYVLGNDRFSCQLCILASLNDLRVGRRHNPALWETLCRMEDESGFTFKHGWSLKALADNRASPLAAPAQMELFDC